NRLLVFRNRAFNLELAREGIVRTCEVKGGLTKSRSTSEVASGFRGDDEQAELISRERPAVEYLHVAERAALDRVSAKVAHGEGAKVQVFLLEVGKQLEVSGGTADWRRPAPAAIAERCKESPFAPGRILCAFE